MKSDGAARSGTVFSQNPDDLISVFSDKSANT